MEESIDQMLARVGADFDRRGKALNRKADAMAHDPRGQAAARKRAAEWLSYGNYAGGKAVFPVRSNDPELSLIFGPERSKAMAANQYINLNDKL